MNLKKSFWILIPPILIFSFVSFIWSNWGKKIASDFAMTQIEKLNSEQSDFSIKVNSFDLSFAKLQGTADQIELSFKNKLQDLPPVKLDQIKLQIDPFDLVIGQLNFAYIKLEQLEWKLDHKAFQFLFSSKDASPTEINLDPLFKILPQVPVKRLFINSSTLSAELPENSKTSLKQLTLTNKQIEFINKKQELEFLFKNSTLKSESTSKTQFDLDLELNGILTSEIIKRIDFKINKNKTNAQLKIQKASVKTLIQNPKFDANLTGIIYLEDLRDMAYVIKKSNQRIPAISGDIILNSSIQSEGLNLNSGQIKIGYRNLSIDTFKFGQGEFTSGLKNNEVSIQQINLQHPSGLAELKNIKLNNNSPFDFKADINLTEFSLQKLFNSLGQNNIPVYLEAAGNAQCSGQIKDFKALCNVNFDVNQIDVDTDRSKKQNIVKIKKANFKGELQAQKDRIDFKAVTNIGNSQFSADGNVDFEQGYKINFASKKFYFEDVENIANLNLKGLTTGTLYAFGDSSYGVIESELKVEKAEIDQFYLGQVQSQFNYKNGIIQLNQFTGAIQQSTYKGDMVVDLNKSSTNGQFKFSPLHVTDALLMIDNKWKLPIDATGTGAADIQFSGPLDFWKMNLSVDLNLKKGLLYGENYSSLKGNLENNGSFLEFKDFKISKNQGYIQLSEGIDTTEDPELNIKISSRSLKIDDIDFFKKFYKNLAGDASIEGRISGPLSEPRILTQNNFNNMQIDGVAVSSSQLKSELNKKYFSASGQIFGRQIQTEFQIPMNKAEKYIIKAQLNDFQPLVLLPLIDLPLADKEISSLISGRINIETLGNDWNHIDGKVNIDKALLQRGLQQINLVESTELAFKKNLYSMKPIKFIGPDQNVTIQLISEKGDPEFYSSGRLFLKPFQFLVPFTENFSGILEYETKLKFNNFLPLFSGEGLIADGHFTTKGFPYPFTQLSAFFDLNGSKIEFTELDASLNQSIIKGFGYAHIQGPKKIDVNIEMKTSQLELDFPKNIITNGNADIQFIGTWLPYTLRINHFIDQGLITKEPGETEKSSTQLLALNSFLPVAEIKNQPSALVFDIKSQFSKGIIVKNSLLDGLITGQINITGSPDSPILSGLVNIQPNSKLFFKDKPFEIQSGFAKFNGTQEINPTLNIISNARVAEYDINLSVKGFAKKHEIKALSQPALNENDIFSLLTLGYLSSVSEQNISSDTQQKQTGLELLSALGNQSELSKKIQSKLGLNVQLSPSIDSTRNIAVPKVIVSKKLGKKLNTSYSRTLTGDRQNNEVKLQWLFRPEASMILNYQNQPSTEELDNQGSKQEDKGIGGFDIEYKREFQ